MTLRTVQPVSTSHLGPDLLSTRAKAHILLRWPRTGAAWIERLPTRVEAVLREWQLELVAPLAGGRSCVLGVRTPEGEDAVLKLAVDSRLVAREALALRHWSLDRHAPCVHRTANDALLIERLPGRPLTSADSSLVPKAAQMLAAAAHSDALPPGIPRIDPQRSMAVAAHRLGRRLPHQWAANAAQTALELLSGAPLVLCHADLVPANLVVTHCGHVKLIDPEPRLGPLSYDLSLLAYRFREGCDFVRLATEVSQHAGVPADPVLAWGPIHAYSQAAWRPNQNQSPDALALLQELNY